jgi:hypothetical protein
MVTILGFSILKLKYCLVFLLMLLKSGDRSTFFFLVL